MAENPEAELIREDIEESRARMGETVEAIGYKADVKSRVKESIADKKDAVVGTIASGKDAVVGTADTLVHKVSGAVPDTDQVKQGPRRSASPRRIRSGSRSAVRRWGSSPA